MTEAKAKRVQELRCGQRQHSWRRISEIIWDEFEDERIVDPDGKVVVDLRGNQLHGMDLCSEAACLLNKVERLTDLPEEIAAEWGY